MFDSNLIRETIFALILTLLSIIGIVGTAYVAIRSIKKTAEENRVSAVHASMCTTLIETTALLSKVLLVLREVAANKHYRTSTGGEFIETAYDRYWKVVEIISRDYRNLESQHRLYLTDELWQKLRKIHRTMNEAKEAVEGVIPDENHIYPNTDEVRTVADKAEKLFDEFIDLARDYIGPDMQKPLTEPRAVELFPKEIVVSRETG